MDLLVAVLVSLALLVLARYLPPRYRTLVVGVLSASVTVALYAQMRAFQQVGQFVSLRMFLAAFTWGLREPAIYAGYLGIKGLSALSGASIFIVGVLWRLQKHDVEAARNDRAERRWATARSVAMFSLLLALILPWLPRVQSTPYHGSVLLKALHAYWGEGEVETEEFADLTTTELLSRYREITHAPAPQRDPEYWGKAEGSNVLFLVFETLPDRFLPADDDLHDLPNLRRLRENSFVALRHYSTYPNTHQALFSFFSSWYPSGVPKVFVEQHPDLTVPSMMRTLSDHHYHTAIYSPDRWDGFLDQEMFRALGVQRQVFPPQTTNDLAIARATRKPRDEATLNLMKQDLEQWLTGGQRFAAAFLPQLGHGPLVDQSPGGDHTDLRKRERTILRTEDAWLGELLQLLEKHHQLEQTVIVITGDHGIRSQQEDPGFVGGMIDEYSFHVPLQVYAPQALDHTVTIPWLTSHIDVAPTVLDLLGVEEGRQFEQGAAIWNANLAKRTTYFFAIAMFGADGYHSDGRFYMWNRMSDTVYENLQPHFDTRDLVARSSPTHSDVSESIARMAGLEQVWATHFSPTNSLRSHLFDHAPEHNAVRTFAGSDNEEHAVSTESSARRSVAYAMRGLRHYFRVIRAESPEAPPIDRKRSQPHA